jgi:hypothetical protein
MAQKLSTRQFDYMNGLYDFIVDNEIDQLVIACDERRNMLPVEDLFKCKTSDVKFLIFKLLIILECLYIMFAPPEGFFSVVFKYIMFIYNFLFYINYYNESIVNY